MDLNKVMLIGRLTRDPEARTTPQGTAVTSFSIATSRRWKDQQGNNQEATEFHNVVAWRKLAEICAQYLRKGKQVYLEGYLQTRSWDDQQTNTKKYRTEIVADNMIMLGNAGDSAGNQQSATSNQVAPATSVATAPAFAEPTAGKQAEVSANVSDEEIKIEDIPF